MENQFAVIKDRLFDVVDDLSKVKNNRDKKLGEITEKLTIEQFNLVVMGQFKRGKSSFINALIGAEILPTSIIPLTSIVTILQYGEESKAIVRYLDETEEEVHLTDIPKFVTEKQNPKNKLRVKEVEILYPSDYLKDGVRIIDTPGVGSVFKHNTDVAYAYLPYVDAGVFIVTPDPPLGEAEHRFLKEVREHADKFIFVLNKTDLVEESDLYESMDFTTTLIREDLGQSINLYPVSAKFALLGKLNNDTDKLTRSNILSFEKDLKDFLHREKGKTFLRSVIGSLLKYTADETMAYKLEQEAARLSVEELRTKIASFEQYADTTQKDRDRQNFILEGHIRKLQQKLDDDLAALTLKELPVLLKKMEEKFAETTARNISSHDLEKDMENFVFNEIIATFNRVRQKEAEKIASILEQIYLDIAKRTNDIIENIVNMTSDLFQVELKPFTTVEKLSKKGEFYFLLKDDPGAIELIGLSIRFALPKFMTKGIILKRMKETISGRFERHCGRVRYDLVRRIDDTSRKFKKTLNEKIDLTVTTIREALNRAMALKDQSENEVSQTLSTLSDRLSNVEEIRNRLFSFQKDVSVL
ncbi:MAG: dynamin family protein [Desulfobacterales bacterium]